MIRRHFCDEDDGINNDDDGDEDDSDDEDDNNSDDGKGDLKIKMMMRIMNTSSSKD